MAHALQTPDASRSRANTSWLADLDAYLTSHEASPGGSRDRRAALVAAVKGNPACAEAWRALLAHEEGRGDGVTHGLTGPTGDTGRVGLYHLYIWATQLVPRTKDAAYLQLWLGYARQQWARNQDDARDTFKTLKNQQIGDGKAHLYHEWAVLEHSAGNISKALGIVAKGLRSEAQPASLLHQLKAEMQSGTFDLKQAGPFTETLTVDASCMATRQLQHMDSAAAAAAAASAIKPAGSLSSAAGGCRLTSSSSAAAAAQAASSAGIPSCLKGAAAGGHAPCSSSQEQSHGRAVTFAAGVQEPDSHDDGNRLHASGSVGGCSSQPRSEVHTHTACLSGSSTSSRSAMSVADGTVPLSSCAVSYKSSTTDSSSLGGQEEDTISCKAPGGSAAPATASKDPKPTTAPLSELKSGPSGGGGHSNTATLGLKRFGFKSRALRVGGSADGGAQQQAQQQQQQQQQQDPTAAAARSGLGQLRASGSMPPPPPVEPAAAAAAAAAGAAGAGAVGPEEDNLAGGRKRRAGQGSTPSPKTSPKLAATCKGGQQHKTQPEAAPPAAQRSLSARLPAGDAAAGSSGSGGASAAQAAATGRQGLQQTSSGRQSPPPSSSDDDSVPLVSSKLAGRLAQDRRTPPPPQPASRGRTPGWQPATAGGGWTPPAEGQLPSSLDSTPEPAPCSGTASSVTGSAAAAAGATAAVQQGAEQPVVQPSRAGQAAVGARGDGLAAAAAASRRQLSAAPIVADGQEQQQPPPLPTIVLFGSASDAPAARGVAGSTQRSSSVGHKPHTGSHQPSSHQPSSTPREPLRPLQAQPHNGPEGHSSATTEQAHTAHADVKAAARTAPAVVPGARSAASTHQQQQQRTTPQVPSGGMQQQQQQRRPVAVPAGPEVPAEAVVRQSRPREDAQTVYVQGVRYTKLECVGRGGSSKVFKVMGPSCKIYALKRIRLAGRDAEAASGFIDEINLLQRLRNKPNIIQLIDSQVFQAEGLIYMVQEYGEIDLARLLAKHDTARRAATPGAQAAPGALLQGNLDENFIRLYWQQMLQAVSGVHEQRIVHSDLKPANFLLVEGQLKLIDFGIAKAISGDTTSIARESQVGTLNYMSPEAILGGSNNILGGPAMRVGRPSDVWSLGCILYQMVYGRTPFAELPFLPKMHAICSPNHAVAYPELANTDLLDVMRRCLDRDPKTRITLQELLDHPLLHPNRRNPAPAPAVGLSEEQMKQLVAQVAAAGAAGMADIDKLTRDLMRKLGASGSSSLKQQQQQQQHSPM